MRVPLMFDESGCEQCRKAWAYGGASIKREDVLDQIVRTNFERQASLYRCKFCGGFWEDPNGNYPTGITATEANEYYGVS